MFEADGQGNHGWGEPRLEDGRPGYNLCHYWTNFEIGNLGFFRSKQYQDLFHKLDRTGKFYYERWGDAPSKSTHLYFLVFYESSH